MGELKALKMEQRIAQRERGLFNENRITAQAAATKCVNGKAGEYSCDKVGLYGFFSHQAMGSATREGNDGREFGLVGQSDGTAFVEIKSDGSLAYLGRLPTQTETSLWRDIKVIDEYAYIGSEATGHGLQVFDLLKLLTVTSPKNFSTSTDLTAWFSGFGSSHNIVSHEEMKMIYAVGSDKCSGGLFMVNVTDPTKPTSPGCVDLDGYVHDAQCVVYKGPDTRYSRHEICFGFNEDTLTVYDVSSKRSPTVISRTNYTGSSYTHQGWLVSDDMRYILLDDELDEVEKQGPAADGHTTTYIFDLASLSKPVPTGYYKSPAIAIDHNQYVKDGLSYQSNYGSGLRIVDVSSVSSDPSGKGFKQVGFFDCYPEDDKTNGSLEFVGTWSVYPYFKSGYVILNSIERGIFSLKYTG
ncbi:hypothetical protein K469DRAFT_730404 [Zopfia rhizophila CBS 207.26]|uniref:Regulatory P domain-containing protein n=1 Tax=Zopfia rhizophila CBS 207.26 TaxID=1314779 RepID=A0A6A6DKC7_9PEZI|nr:hypothetical protein K469DRAFT_730404 [Zopfia rhizophila CBS 207.26]